MDDEIVMPNLVEEPVCTPRKPTGWMLSVHATSVERSEPAVVAPAVISFWKLHHAAGGGQMPHGCIQWLEENTSVQERLWDKDWQVA